MEPTESVPQPTSMPVDMESWAGELNLSNFVNAYYQFRDLQGIGGCKRILIVGPGQGLEAAVLKWRGYQVTTIDIDQRLKPDHVGSVHSMPMFSSQQFDAVIASHVLEHFAIDYLDQAIGELARVAKFALVYLPVHGRHAQLRWIPGIRGWDWTVTMDVFNYFEKPTGREPRFMGGQHFWELGMRGFRIKDLRKRLSQSFLVLASYRNRDWLPSYNFVLKSNSMPTRT
jgi:hypothetical protein